MKIYAKLGGKQMTFKGFSKKDFKTMQISGLEARMTGIQNDIQPKFRAVGEELTTYLSASLAMKCFYILLVTKDVQLTHLIARARHLP